MAMSGSQCVRAMCGFTGVLALSGPGCRKVTSSEACPERRTGSTLLKQLIWNARGWPQSRQVLRHEPGGWSGALSLTESQAHDILW